MDNKLRRITHVLIGLLTILGLLSCIWTFLLRPNAPHSIFNETIGPVANALFSASNIKENIDGQLRQHVTEISIATNMDEASVTQAINDLDIPHWEIVALPHGITATSNFDIAYQGINATITTYNNPCYLTLDAYGQALTFEVPPTAQSYAAFLSYL